MAADPPAPPLAGGRLVAFPTLAEVLDRLLTEGAVATFFVAIALVFNLFYLAPTIGIHIVDVNDNIFHFQNLQRAADAFRHGQDPTDVWLPEVGLGFPVFHFYQHFPYLIPAAFADITGANLRDTLAWTNYLLLSVFPLTTFFGIRRFGFSPITAAACALLSCLISTNGLFGLDYGSYVWRGYGLYTQLWGMVFLPAALGQCYHAMTTGRGFFLAVVLLALAALSHLMAGYIAIISLAVFVFLVPRRDEVLRRLGRLAIIGVFFALATSYFLIPLVRDAGYLNRSVWDSAYKYDSFGAKTVLGWLFDGKLLDFGRFPVFTLLTGLGLAVCLRGWRDPRYRAPAVFAVLWLLAYFGRPTWGFLLDLTPLAKDLYLHRLVFGTHMGAIFLAGIGLAAPWSWAFRYIDNPLTLRHSKGALLVPLLVTIVAVLPLLNDRANYLIGNRDFMRNQQVASEIEQTDVDGLIATLKGLPPGRVYAGLAAQWGESYRVGAVPMYSILGARGFETFRLYHPWSLNGDVEVLFDERRADEYDTLNIRYVVAPADHTFPDFVRPVASFGRHRLYQVETGGFFTLGSSDAAFTADKHDWYPGASAWFRSGEPAAKEFPSVYFGKAPFDPKVTTLPMTQAETFVANSTFLAGDPRGAVDSETVTADSFAATVNVARAGVLVLKATYNPGWHATLDGRSVPVRMVMPSYMAIDITPGAHTVRFAYKATTLRHLLMLLGLISLAALAFAESRRDQLLPRLTRRLERSPALTGVSDYLRGLFPSQEPPTQEHYASGLPSVPSSGPPSGSPSGSPSGPLSLRERVRACPELVEGVRGTSIPPSTASETSILRSTATDQGAEVPTAARRIRARRGTGEGIAAPSTSTDAPVFEAEAVRPPSETTTPPTPSPTATPAPLTPSLRSYAAVFLDWLLAGTAVRALAIIMAAAFAVRLVLLPFYAYLPGEALDEYAWERWMNAIHRAGILNVFRVTHSDHVGYHWVLWLLATAYGWFGGVYKEFPPHPGQYAAFPFGLHVLMKVPPLAFDALLILAVYAATSLLMGVRSLLGASSSLSPGERAGVRGHARGALKTPKPLLPFRLPSFPAIPALSTAPGTARLLPLIAAAAIAFHPVVFYESAVWAQIDAAGAAAMLASLALVAARRPGWGWAAWALGFLIKPQSFVILPALVLLTFAAGGLAAFRRATLAAALVAAVALGPWVLHGDLGRLNDTYHFIFGGSYYTTRLSAEAWNLWWIADLSSHHLPSDVLIAGLTFKTAGLLLSAAAGLLATAYLASALGLLTRLLGVEFPARGPFPARPEALEEPVLRDSKGRAGGASSVLDIPSARDAHKPGAITRAQRADSGTGRRPGNPDGHEISSSLSPGERAGVRGLSEPIDESPSPLHHALIAAAYLVFAFYLLPTSVHERYLYPFVALLLPVAVADRRWRRLYVAVSVTFGLNLLLVAPPIHAWMGKWQESTFSEAVSLLNIALFAYFTWLLARDIPWRRLLAHTEGPLRSDRPSPPLAESPLDKEPASQGTPVTEPARVNVAEGISLPLHAVASGPAPAAHLRALWARTSSRTRLALSLYLVLAALYLATTSGHFFSSEEGVVYETSKNLVSRGQLTADTWWRTTTTNRDGVIYSDFEPGQSVLSTPLYAIGRAVEAASPPTVDEFFSGRPAVLPNHNWSGTTPIFFVSLFNVVVTPMIAVVLFLFCLRLGFPARASLLTALIYGVATMAWSGANTYFQHPLETLALLMTAYLLYANRGEVTRRSALLAGAAFAVGILTRLNILIAGPALWAYFLFVLAGDRTLPSTKASLVRAGFAAVVNRWRARLQPGDLRLFAAFVTPQLVAIACILVLNHVRYGDFFTFHGHGAADEGTSTFSLLRIPSGLAGNLLSPGRSLFLYSPPVLVGLAFSRRLLRDHPSEGVLFAAIAAVYLLVYSAFWNWADRGGPWGTRFLEPIVPLLIVPAGYAFENSQSRRLLFRLAAAGAAIQFLGVALYEGTVIWDWVGDGRFNSYVTSVSYGPIPTHLHDLLRGHYINPWLGWVFSRYGPAVFLVALAVPATISALAFRILRAELATPCDHPRNGSGMPGPFAAAVRPNRPDRPAAMTLAASDPGPGIPARSALAAAGIIAAALPRPGVPSFPSLEALSPALNTKAVAFAAIAAIIAATTLAAWRHGWMSDDAMITFRYVRNFLDGYGPVFNVGDRVQGYTHPLWFFLLIPALALYNEPFEVVFVLGTALTLVTVAVVAFALWRRAGPLSAVAAIALICGVLCSSDSWLSFQSSGLENPLTHLLTALLVIEVFRTGGPRLFVLSLLASLLLVCRLDLVFLLLPVGACVLFCYRERPRLLVPALVGALPLVAWMVFARLYYGSILPNTASAKLGIFASWHDSVAQGLAYLGDWFHYELVPACLSVLLLVTAAVIAIRQRNLYVIALALGTVLEAGYVVYIGGDYMRGRFFLSSFVAANLLGAFSLATTDLRPRIPMRVIAFAGAAIGLALLVWLPLRPGQDNQQNYGGITNERLVYDTYHVDTYKEGTLAAWESNPAIIWSSLRMYSEKCGPTSLLWGALGVSSYLAGPNVRMIDLFGLTDKTVASLPRSSLVLPRPRPGHPLRLIPVSYLASLGDVGLDPNWRARVNAGDCSLRTQFDSMRTSSQVYNPDTLRIEDLPR